MKLNQIIAPSIGNILEWFDFGLFIYLAPILGRKFFPAQDQTTGTLSAFGLFAAGFICRPLGGILFGYYGDKFGRVGALRLSIFSITLTTFLVSLLPTYETIGVWATVLFTILRLVQGLSVGGEYAGSAVYLTESAPEKYKGFITSFAPCGANFGFLLATLAAFLLKIKLSETLVEKWAWRLPFLFSGLLGLLILGYRLKIAETKVYNYLKYSNKLNKRNLLSILRKEPLIILVNVGLTCMGSTLYYVFFGYMSTYLGKNNISLSAALGFQALLLFIMMFLVPFFGWCGDHLGRKKVLSITSIGTAVLSIPCFYLLNQESLTAVFCALGIATILSSAEQGNTLGAANENTEPNVRYTIVSFTFNLGNALFGGTAPFIVSLMIRKWNYLSPAYYLTSMAILSWLATFGLKNKINSK